MAQPTLQAVFGPGATQDATTITILKADLPGLTPAIDNNGEQIFSGVMVRAKGHLTQVNQDANPDQSIVIETGFPSLVQRNDQTFRQNQLTVNFQKPDLQAEIDPDDY